MDKIDTFGKWFLVFESRNECCDGIFGIYDRNNRLETRFYPHARYDGYSVLNEYIAEAGAPVPAQHPGHPPGVFRQLKAFVRLLAGLPLRPASRKMRTKSNGWPARPLVVNKDRIAWRIFSPLDTQKISGYAQQDKVTLNSHLLSGLIRHLGPLWEDRSAKISAGITVSLHKSLGVDTTPRNRFSIIDIWLDETDRADEINRQIRQALRRDRHLASWVSYNLPRYVGDWFYRYFPLTIGYFQYRNIVVTNVGVWGASSGNSVFLIPPVFHYNPVSVGIIIWEGKLSISIQAHPHVDINRVDIENIMDNWSRDLLRVTETGFLASSTTIGELNPRKMH